MSKKKRPSAASKRTVSRSTEQNPIGNQSVARGLILALLIGFGLITVTTALSARTATPTPSSANALGPTFEDFSEQPRIHINPGTSHPAYNSNPPTSGWHYPAPADWGIYQQSLPDELLVHNLEHGGIWLSYRDAGDTQTISQLEAIARRYPDHVILTYRPANDRPIAVAAWTHLLKLDAVDSKAILDFITRYIRQGPENV